jgi:hypothetical protein
LKKVNIYYDEHGKNKAKKTRRVLQVLCSEQIIIKRDDLASSRQTGDRNGVFAYLPPEPVPLRWKSNVLTRLSVGHTIMTKKTYRTATGGRESTRNMQKIYHQAPTTYAIG